MKRRIICSVLVVVMLVLSLASCGYSFAKDDLTQYMSFDKTAFEATLAALEIEEGDFTTNEDTRKEKIEDYIYNLLAEEVKSDTKLDAGTVDSNDQLYYCYYVTYTDKDSNEFIIYPSQMQESKVTSIQIGKNDLTGYQKEFRNKLLELGEFEIGDYIYKTVTDDTHEVEEGDVAFISYTVTGTDSKVTKYNYQKVTLSEQSDNVVVKKLLEKDENGKVKIKIGETLTEDSANPLKDEAGNTYTAAKINWIATKPGREIVFNYTLEKETSYTDLGTVVGTETTKVIAKDEVITYHAVPVSYIEVAEVSADMVLKTLLSSLPLNTKGEARELECLKEADELMTAMREALTPYNEAKSALKTAETAVTTAQKTFDELDPESTEAVKNKAQEDLDAKKTARDTAKTTLDEKETALNAELTKIYNHVNAEDVDAAKTKIVDEYKDAVKDYLTEKYNDEIKLNAAEALWNAMVANATVTGYPKEAVSDIYDRMFEIHERKFYSEKNTSTSKSYYSEYGGDFEAYFMATMKKESGWACETFEDAKHALWAEAEEYVADMTVIYFVADIYDLTYDKKEIREFKKNKDGVYEYNSQRYGKMNALAAHQFDAVVDYFLEVETKEVDGEKEVVYNETTGEPTYTRVTIIKKAK